MVELGGEGIELEARRSSRFSRFAAKALEAGVDLGLERRVVETSFISPFDGEGEVEGGVMAARRRDGGIEGASVEESGWGIGATLEGLGIT